MDIKEMGPLLSWVANSEEPGPYIVIEMRTIHRRYDHRCGIRLVLRLINSIYVLELTQPEYQNYITFIRQGHKESVEFDVSDWCDNPVAMVNWRFTVQKRLDANSYNEEETEFYTNAETLS